MKRNPIRGLMAAAFLATTLWSGTPAFASDIGEEIRIDGGQPSVSKAGFDISGDYAVWIVEGEKTITLYDLEEETEIKIGDKQSDKTSPRVDGQYVVWIDSRHGGSDVYLYDIGMKKETRLTDGTAKPAELEISDNNVVWTDHRDGKSDIYLYNIKTGEVTRVSNSGKASHPAVSSNYVAWEDDRNGNADIYYYEIDKKQEKAATTNRSDQTNPSLYLDQIVYENDKSGDADIYVYSIGSGREKQLTDDSEDQTLPALYRDSYVFVEDGDLLIGDVDDSGSDEIESRIYEKLPPRIYGDYVLFAKQDSDNHLQIKLYNLDDEEMVEIGGMSGEPNQPDGDDRYVVYISETKNTANVILHDLETKTNTVVSKAGSEPTRPLVSSRYVVWYDEDEEALISYDIKRGQQKRVTDENATPSDSLYELYGNKLLWVDQDRKYDLYVTDLSSGDTEEITSLGDEPQTVDIYDNFVMWVTDNGSDTGSIYLYDLAEEDETEIRKDVEVKGASLGENFVVWSERTTKTNSFDLYYYDIDRGRTELVIRWTERDQVDPQASRSMVFFADNRISVDKNDFYYELYDINDGSFSQYYWSDDAEIEQPRLNGNRLVWIDTRDSDDPAVYTMAFARPNDDDDDDDDNGGGDPGDGDYKEYYFQKVFDDGTFADVIGQSDFDKVFFVFRAGTNQEVAISISDIFEDSSEFIKWMNSTPFDEIVIRVYN
jgi:beta propeller repeat protein